LALAYERISEDLTDRIESGEMKAGERLPGEHDLATRYGVTRMTVRHALSSLVERGLIYRRHGVGTFVADPSRRRRSLNRLTSFSEDMAAGAREFVTELLAKDVRTADADVVDALELSGGAEVIYISRLRIVDGVPGALQNSWVPLGRCPSLARQDLIEDSLYTTLERTCDVTLKYADQHIRAVAAGNGEASSLQVEAGSPLLRTERITRDDRDVAVELARSWTRPEFELVTRLER
jgi:GntR family transcriptional regulator